MPPSPWGDAYSGGSRRWRRRSRSSGPSGSHPVARTATPRGRASTGVAARLHHDLRRIVAPGAPASRCSSGSSPQIRLRGEEPTDQTFREQAYRYRIREPGVRRIHPPTASSPCRGPRCENRSTGSISREARYDQRPSWRSDPVGTSGSDSNPRPSGSKPKGSRRVESVPCRPLRRPTCVSRVAASDDVSSGGRRASGTPSSHRSRCSAASGKCPWAALVLAW